MRVLPMAHKLAVLVAKQRRDDHEELYRHYMGGIVEWMGGKSFAAILETLEYSQKSENEKQRDIEDARSTAFDVIARLEKARGGV